MDLQEEKSSKPKMMWIIVGVVIALIILGASVYALIMAAAPRKAEQTNQPTNSQEKPVSAEEVRLGLDDLGKTMDQEKIDRDNAQKALDEKVNRIKLSN